MKFTESKVSECQTMELPKIHNPAGNITAINEYIDIPFKIKRVYYLYDVPGGEERGGHAHKNLYQLVVAASGSFDIVLDDGKKKKKISLNRPYIGLNIVPGIWREVINFSSGSICLVLASKNYTAEDYIRDYIEFKKLKIK